MTKTNINSPKDVHNALCRVRKLIDQAVKLWDKIELLRNRSEKGYGYSISAGHGDGIGDSVAALADAENRYDELLSDLSHAEGDAHWLIGLINDKREQRIMHDRYCQCDPWSKIALRYDMTHDEILHLDNRICEKIYKKLNNNY